MSFANDLYDNPFVNSAKKAMTQEQIEEYKKVGEYMYNSIDYKEISLGSKVQVAGDDDLLFYATEAIKSGMDPKDLSHQELQLLLNSYGIEWFRQFGFEDNEINTLIMTPENLFNDVKNKIDNMNLKKSYKNKLKKKLEKKLN